eukprot:1779426-Alexandrium_andersonii.AAC.1
MNLLATGIQLSLRALGVARVVRCPGQHHAVMGHACPVAARCDQRAADTTLSQQPSRQSPHSGLACSRRG